MIAIQKTKVYSFEHLDHRAKERAKQYLCNQDSFYSTFENLEDWALNPDEFPHVKKFSIYSWDLNPSNVALCDNLDLDIIPILKESAGKKTIRAFERWPWLTDYIGVSYPNIYWRNSRSPEYEIDFRHARADKFPHILDILRDAIERLNSYISDIESAIMKSILAQESWFYSDERCKEEAECLELVFDENGNHFYLDDSDVEFIDGEPE